MLMTTILMPMMATLTTTTTPMAVTTTMPTTAMVFLVRSKERRLKEQSKERSKKRRLKERHRRRSKKRSKKRRLKERHHRRPDTTYADTPLPPRYNLRRHPTATRRFNQAIDEPHSGKAYYLPTQLLQYTKNAALRAMVFGLLMTQMSAKAGIRKHGAAAEAAVMEEFMQLEDLGGAYESINPATLTKAQKQGALRALNLLKEKRCSKLKGRTVADGRPQKGMYDKSETASPTVSTDGLMLSIMIDAHEGRDVGTADVAGAYLKAYMTDFVIMKFTGEMVDILCKMNSQHIKFVVIENGTKVLYVRLIKALYGCVKTAMLWYDLFTNTLTQMGFVLNPYDPCIANAIIKGKQCTIAWYVDDNKISHVDPDVVTMVTEKMEQRFDKMTVTRGKEHVFLGMNIRYTDTNTAVITMKDYLRESIEESGLDIRREAATPAKKNLFEVNDASTRLEGNRAEAFHSVVCKLLYVAIRARMDILLAVSFLCIHASPNVPSRTRLSSSAYSSM